MLGWGEFELEVMRDRTDNVVIVCSIENLDPMGVHTGDSVCVAPQQTLSDHLYQQLRDQAIKVIRAIGVETGGSNVQFAVNPATEEIIVIEMNPRVSRSSALASKATGFPIAKIAARLAVGYTLQEITNDITRATPASFEPAIDYCVVKWPRFAFEKFPGAEHELTTHMKSVGEAMAIGRTFRQAFAKALRSRELDSQPRVPRRRRRAARSGPRSPAPSASTTCSRRCGVDTAIGELNELTRIDPWFLRELQAVATDPEARLHRRANLQVGRHLCGRVRRADPVLLLGLGAAHVRWAPDGQPLPAHEVDRGSRPSVVILGSGPNRIGQGIEFDYCCVHAAQTVRESGRDAVMINCNPETVSTDYDTSDRLYFEPLTLEDVLGVCEVEKPEGVIVQFGGQTPLKLAAGLRTRASRSSGRRTDAIDLAEDRARFGPLLDELGYKAPPYASASTPEEALARAPEVGFPLLVRPSYVLGGRAMEIVYSVEGLEDYLERVGVIGEAGGRPARARRSTSTASSRTRSRSTSTRSATARTSGSPGSCSTSRRPGSTPVTRPACCRRTRSAGEMLDEIRAQATGIAKALGVVGLLNVQFAIHASEGLHVIEANPRASRTVPFVSKAIGLPVAKLACRIMLGEKIADLGLPDEVATGHVCVKEAVLPFDRFAGTDVLLGPEMRSTGEVMGIARDFPTAFAKAQAAAGARLPDERDGVPHRSPTATSPRPPRSRSRSTTWASSCSPRAAPPGRSRAWASRRRRSTS